MSERILLIGSGGREHAIAAALHRSPSCDKLYCAPGNPGIGAVAEVMDVNVGHHAAVISLAREHEITLVVIGPEQPLADGLADSLRAAGLDVFGPSQAAAQLESSKGFSKDFMQRHRIPTAPYARFDKSQEEHAVNYVSHHELPVVVKYDGLAAGKGVVVAETTQEARQAVHSMFEGAFGNDGVVIEGFLRGQEASVFAVTDGTNYVVLSPSQDHKRIGDDDVGKNTGGMGSYAPAPIVTEDVLEKVKKFIIEPTLSGMAEEGMPFVGCLYCGLMIDDGEPSVVEFNARFGDPETQVVMSLLQGDVAALFASAARGALNASAVQPSDAHAVCVVLASGGYPDAYENGKVISGICSAEQDSGVTVYHAGTKMMEGDLVTNGGRVLGVTAIAPSLEEARNKAYTSADKISFEGKTYRTDIANKALTRSTQETA